MSKRKGEIPLNKRLPYQFRPKDKEADQVLAKLKGKLVVVNDIIEKLEKTNQTYIIGHDVPLSISKGLFEMLDARRKEEAVKREVPVIQYEFEDIIALLLGIDPR